MAPPLDCITLDGDTLVVKLGNNLLIYYRDSGGDNNWGLVKEIDLSGKWKAVPPLPIVKG